METDLIPNPLLRAGAEGYVFARRITRSNTFSYNVAGCRISLKYWDRPSFLSVRSFLSKGGTTAEGIDVKIFNLDGSFDSVIDVGAHEGHYTTLLAKLNPEIPVFSFEPATGPRERLLENLQENGISESRVAVSNSVVTDKTGEEQDFFVDHSGGEVGSSTQSQSGTSAEKRRTQAISDLIREKSLNKIFLKIDAEGEEFRIIRDISETEAYLSGVIEFHPDKMDVDSERDVIMFLQKNGFETEYICNSSPGHKHPRPMYRFENKSDSLDSC